MNLFLKKTTQLTLLLLGGFAWACDACKLQQPPVTKNFTHGTGPESDWDWVIVGMVILLTLLAFIYSVKYLVKPGERDENHIKYSVLSDEK